MYLNGSEVEQECYSADSGESRFSCEGEETCTMDVTGYSGEEITWKSSCGGYAYTKINGENKYAEFDCTGEIGGSLQNIGCSDSDGGKNYYVQGKVGAENLANGIEYDICNTRVDLVGSLREFYCEDGLATETRFFCPDGCFDGACIGGEVTEIEISDDNFRYAKWECYDGTFESQGEESSCKPTGLWKAYAEQFCVGKCSEETGKCGVNSFSIGGECSDGIELTEGGSLGGLGEVPLEIYLNELERVVGELLILVGESDLTNVIDSLIYEIEENAGLNDRIKILVERLKQLEIQLESDDELKLFNEAKSLTNKIKARLSSGSFEGTSFREDTLICKNSCPFENSCLPIGVRTDGKYCNIKGELTSQLEGDDSCNNSFECGSNVCVNSQCIDEGFIKKIINFFRNLFGSN